jgi:hypothetical protein
MSAPPKRPTTSERGRETLTAYFTSGLNGPVIGTVLKEDIFRARMVSSGALLRILARNRSRCCRAWFGCC